ncbi:MAG: chloride channel protein [Phycisphaerae bacterium]|mgnify:CR=1 FL=1|nr:chloride channel protein [Phycisphaerae bacterium]
MPPSSANSPPNSDIPAGAGEELLGLWRRGMRATAWPQLLLAAVFGVFMGLVALGFMVPFHWAESGAAVWATHHPDRLFWAILFVPAIGGFVCALIRWALPVDLRGHGVSMVMYSVARLRSDLPLKLAFRQWLGSTATIVTGGSAGPEGPIVAIGATLGSTFGRLARQDREWTTTLLGAGAAAGIAAVFNAPIAGVFFALEVLLRDFSLRTLAPIVVASVLASATTQTVLGSRQPLFGVDPSVFESMRGLLTVTASPAFVLLGCACGMIGVTFVRTLRGTERFFTRLRVPALSKPALGGLVLGVMGATYFLITTQRGDPTVPNFLGNGYPLIERVLSPEMYDALLSSTPPVELAGVMLVWLVLKMLATCVTLGSGGSGGLFAPSLVLGALTGGALGLGIAATGLMTNANPAHFALIGMAGMIAATTHAPLTGILLVYELTQDYSMILPVMLTATIATIVARAIERESVYTAELAVQGVRLGTRGDSSQLRRLTVRDVTLAPAVFIKPDDTAERLLELAERMSVDDFVVLGPDQRYRGVVGGNEMRAVLMYREASPLLHVSEIMHAAAPTIMIDETLDVALERFGESELDSLPVVDAAGRVEGLLTRERLMRRYHRELERDA